MHDIACNCILESAATPLLDLPCVGSDGTKNIQFRAPRGIGEAWKDACARFGGQTHVARALVELFLKQDHETQAQLAGALPADRIELVTREKTAARPFPRAAAKRH